MLSNKAGKYQRYKEYYCILMIIDKIIIYLCSISKLNNYYDNNFIDY
jgi:hypothetical protein